MYTDLLGKVAVITGASQGIGRGIAERFGKERMKVVVNYLDHDGPAKEVVEIIKAYGGEATAVRADVRSEEDIQHLVQTAVESYGTLHVMVNNAGIETSSPSHQLSLSEWNRILEVNLTGAFLGSREAIKVMRAQNVRGTIINISSVHQKIPKAMHVHYATSKGGLRLMTESLAAEYAHQGIRVNAIAPGAIRTNMNKHLLDEPQMKETILNLIPMRKIGSTDQIGSAAAWLASEESSYVTGITMFVDGGMTLYPSYVQQEDD